MSQLVPHRAESRRFALGEVSVVGLDGRPPAGSHRRGTALLVPGYTGSKEDFAPLFDPLADAGFRVVAIDLPGQYESGGPDDSASYTVAWLGDVVRAVAKELDDGPVHLLGHSFGGLVARATAIAEPSSFRSLTLLCSGPAAITGPRRDRMELLEPMLLHGMEVVYEAIERFAHFDPKWRAAPEELKRFLKHRFVSSSAAGLKGMGEALSTEPDRTEELAATDLPLLVCYGEHDDAWHPEIQAEMAGRLGARRAVVTAAAHSPAVENTAATAAVLAAFWAESHGGD